MGHYRLRLFTVATASVLALTAGTAALGYSASQSELQDTQDQSLIIAHAENGVSYVTGGIGDEERAAIQAQQQHYNLHVTNTDHNGAYVGDTHVAIYDRHGNTLASQDVGPLFYAELPRGRYTIVASNDAGDEKRKIVTINHSAKNVNLVW